MDIFNDLFTNLDSELGATNKKTVGENVAKRFGDSNIRALVTLLILGYFSMHFMNRMFESGMYRSRKMKNLVIILILGFASFVITNTPINAVYYIGFFLGLVLTYFNIYKSCNKNNGNKSKSESESENRSSIKRNKDDVKYLWIYISSACLIIILNFLNLFGGEQNMTDVINYIGQLIVILIIVFAISKNEYTRKQILNIIGDGSNENNESNESNKNNKRKQSKCSSEVVSNICKEEAFNINDSWIEINTGTLAWIITLLFMYWSPDNPLINLILLFLNGLFMGIFTGWFSFH